MKRRMSLVLLLALLLTSTVALFSCKKETETLETTGTVETKILDEWGREMIYSPLDESLYYEGETVKVICREGNMSESQFVESELEADVLNQAIVKRNDMIKTRLGVSIECEPTQGGNFNGAMNTKLRNQVNSGLCEYDLVANFAYYGSALAMEGYYYDWSKTSNLHINEPYWNQSYIEESVIGDRMYMLVNDSCLMALKYTFVTFFNKKLAADYLNNESLYAKVDSGEWTMEYFNTLLKGIYEEKDGDNQPSGGDLYGMITSTSCQNTDAFFVGMGLRNCTFNDESGMPELSINNDITMSGYEIVKEMLFSNAGVYVNGKTTEDYVAARELFSASQSVFSTGQLDNGGYFLTAMDDAFGILPMPKMDESDTYTTTAQDAYDILAMLSSISKERAEMVAAVTEYMAYASYFTTKPTYFETVTKLRYSDEYDDARMFDIISEGMYFDFGMIYSSSVTGNGINLGHFWRSLFQNEVSNFASHWAKYESTYSRQLQSVIDMLME